MITTIVGTVLGAVAKLGEKFIDYKNAKVQIEFEQQRFQHERLLNDQEFKHSRLMQQSVQDFELTKQDKSAYLDLELSANDLVNSAVTAEGNLVKGDWRGLIRPLLTGVLLSATLFAGYDYLATENSVVSASQFQTLLVMVLDLTGFAVGFWFGARGASRFGKTAVK